MNVTLWLSRAPAVLIGVESLLALGWVVSSAELLTLYRELRDDGVLSWRIQRLNHGAISRTLERSRVDTLFAYPAVLGLFSMRLVASIVVIVQAARGGVTFAPLLAVTLLTVLLILRGNESNDGSDQMLTIATIACFLAELVGTATAAALALVFVAAQASLAYATSGLLKAPVRGWWNGTYVAEILATAAYGNAELFAVVRRRPWLAKFLGASVVVGDTTLAIACLLPPPICLGILSLGFALHLGIARVLGLNTFLWAFAATYPACWWVSNALHVAR